jgi:hypothetical protein
MEKPCQHSRGHIDDSIIIKLGQDACLGDSSDDFEHGSSRMKKKSQEIKEALLTL